MRMDSMINSKPVIKVFFDQDKLKETDIQEVLWGIKKKAYLMNYFP